MLLRQHPVNWDFLLAENNALQTYTPILMLPDEEIYQMSEVFMGAHTGGTAEGAVAATLPNVYHFNSETFNQAHEILRVAFTSVSTRLVEHCSCESSRAVYPCVLV